MTAARSQVDSWIGCFDWHRASLAGYYCVDDDGALSSEKSVTLREPGTQFFVDKLVSELPAGVLQTNKRVKHIDYSGRGCRTLSGLSVPNY